MPESRQYNAEYYDAFEWSLDDVQLYKKFVTPETEVLELGCGTGRVTIPLAINSKNITAVDISQPMLELAQLKSNRNNIKLLKDDITSIRLKQKFDLIIAPFRVLQCLEKQEQVSGMFEVIRTHLKPSGTAILNIFNPHFSREEMPLQWITKDETFCGETTLSNGDTLKLFDTRKTLDTENQILYPEMIYRRYNPEGKLVSDHVNPISMRYYYPDEFKSLIESEGFEITNTWGGYKNEKFGLGPELVIAFKHKQELLL